MIKAITADVQESMVLLAERLAALEVALRYVEQKNGRPRTMFWSSREGAIISKETWGDLTFIGPCIVISFLW